MAEACCDFALSTSMAAYASTLCVLYWCFEPIFLETNSFELGACLRFIIVCKAEVTMSTLWDAFVVSILAISSFTRALSSSALEICPSSLSFFACL